MIKTILVIGASRGIGKDTVLKFAKNENYQVIALSRNIKKMEAAFAGFQNVQSFQYDLCSDDPKSNLEKILKNTPQVDILINNAGYLVNKPFIELTKKDFLDSFNANAIGVMQSVQAVLPKMQKNGGHVLSISTMGAFQGSAKFPGLAAYSTSKTGVVTMTELLAEEFKESKIKFNCLCLGAVQTEMLIEAFPGYEAPLSSEEMSGYIHDFALNAPKFLNGKIIPVSLSTP